MIYNGDCIEVLKEIKDETVDLVVTDPPYLINYKSGRKPDDYRIKNDTDTEKNREMLSKYIQECYRILKNDTALYVFCTWKTLGFFLDKIEKLFNIKNVMIWDKVLHTAGDVKCSYAPKYEMIIYANKGKCPIRGHRDTDIIKCKSPSRFTRLHPMEKPVELMEKLISKSSDDESVVFDGFMGVGTVGVACKNINRRFIGVELDKKYFDIASKRLE